MNLDGHPDDDVVMLDHESFWPATGSSGSSRQRSPPALANIDFQEILQSRKAQVFGAANARRENRKDSSEEKLKDVRAALDDIVYFVRDYEEKHDNFKEFPDAFTGIYAAYPEIIQEICAIACCLPVTQDAVERVFSALRFILSDYRGNLGDETLDSILFLRMNKMYD